MISIIIHLHIVKMQNKSLHLSIPILRFKLIVTGKDMKPAYQKGQSLELVIDDLAFGARGVARDNDFVWLVERGIPGQRVKAKVSKVKRSYGEAFIESVLEESPHQVKPHCPHFGICGGCQLQHLDYAVQVESKTQQIVEVLKRIGNLANVTVNPTFPADPIYRYRNKMEFTFSNRRWLLPDDPLEKPKEFSLGLHVPRRYDKVLDIDTCHLQSEIGNRIRQTIRELTFQSGLLPYSIKTHRGYWRFVVIREGVSTGEIMVNLITSNQEGDEGKKIVTEITEQIIKRHPEVTTFIHSISDKKAQVAFGENEILLHGPGKIIETIGESRFEISPNAFFQTNSHQCRRLFETIQQQALLTGTETLYDLYCGTGAIGLFLANKVKQVLGIEVIAPAVEDARRNAQLNDLSNVEFLLADMKDALIDIEAVTNVYGEPDLVILDPPRGGTHPKTIKHLLRLAPPRIVYVSCNPAILARDLEILCEKAYTPETVQPVDMFPHTGHIEVVVALTRNQ